MPIHRNSIFVVSAVLCSTLARAEAPPRPLDDIIMGTAYNIFHEEYSTDEEFAAHVDRDIAGMKAVHLNSVLAFPLAQWDTATRQHKWKRTDHLVRRIEENKFHLVPILFKEQQGRYFLPMWTMRDNPEVWALHESNAPNSREDADIETPAVAAALDNFLSAFFARYQKSPSLLLHNIWNEPHYRPRDEKAAFGRFRTWLEGKYGTLDELGRVWAEDYTDWDQVTPRVNDNWDSSMPGIDWQLFLASQNAQILSRLRATSHRLDPRHPVVANPVGDLWTNPGIPDRYSVDGSAIADESDVVGISHYPDQWERVHGAPYPTYRHAFVFNHTRSIAGPKQYILNELQTNARSALALHGYLTYDDLYVTSWLAFANDCKGIIYWKWEPFLRGRQSFGRGLTLTTGELSDRGRAVADVGAVVARHGKTMAAATPEPARAGILLDNVGLLKSLEAPESRSAQLLMKDSYEGTFRALFDAQIPVDAIRMDRPLTAADLARYRVLYLPFQMVVSRKTAAILREFVSAGGWLVADARSAVMDDRDFGYEINPGAGLSTLFGVERLDFIGSAGTHAIEITNAAAVGLTTPGPHTIAGVSFREKWRLLPGADVVARFPDNGEPAMVIRREGKGMAVLCAVPLGGTYQADTSSPAGGVLAGLARLAQASPSASFVTADAVAAGVEVKLHRHTGGTLVYVVNTRDIAVSGSLQVPSSLVTTGTEVRDLVTDAPLLGVADKLRMSFEISLAPRRAALVSIPNAPAQASRRAVQR